MFRHLALLIWSLLPPPPPMISPHQAAVPRHHFKKKPYCRERRRNKNKNKNTLFCCNKPGKGDWFISEEEVFWDSQFTCCLCNFTSLRSCSTSIFSFSFSGKSSMWRAGIFTPELGLGTALQVERLEVLANQGASQNNCCACAPRPPAPVGTAFLRGGPSAPRAQLPPASALTPAAPRPKILKPLVSRSLSHSLFSGPHNPGRPVPRILGWGFSSIGVPRTLKSFALPGLSWGRWPGAWPRHTRGGPAWAGAQGLGLH